MKKQTKKKNAQDLTLRNLRALKKEQGRQRLQVGTLAGNVTGAFELIYRLQERIAALENASLPKTKR